MPLLRLDRFRAFLPPRFSAAALFCRRAFLPPRFSAAALFCRRAFLPPRLSAAAPSKCAVLASLVALIAIVAATPAHAGHWVLTTTGSGEADLGTTDMVDFVPPPPATNSVTIYGFGAGHGTGGPSSNSVSTSANLSITVTGTWTTDSNSDNTAPPGVLLSESSSASGAFSSNGGPTQPGSANDGFGDPVGQSGSTIGLSTTNGARYVKASGGSFTVSLTLSASATGSSGPGSSCGAGSNVGPITISIHAQPYGWYDAGHLENGVFVAGPHVDNTTGELAFSYGWLSTSGNLGDLKGITIYEIVDYSGNPGTMSADKTGFYPQSPPVVSGYEVANGKAGTPYDASQLYAHDVHSAFPTVSPLQPLAALTWTIPQKYEFDDPATGEKGTVLKDEGNIVDMLQINPNQFTVSKSGVIAKKPL